MKLIGFLVLIVVSYFFLTLIIYLFSNFGIFPRFKATYKDSATILKLITADDKKISAIYIENSMAQFTVLFSHGNAEDLGTIGPFLKAYAQHGFSVFAYDYHGYGTSEGWPTENNTYKDINAAYQYLTQVKKIAPTNIIIHGRSLGTGPSIDLAMREPFAGLIVESGMVTAFRVITGIALLPLDKFRSNLKISHITKPILFIHGKKDKVISFWHGKQLYDLTTATKYFYTVDNAGHNDVEEVAGEEYWKTIKNFSQQLNEL